MSTSVVLIVLFGAFLHASWNTIVKSGGDKYLNAVLVVGGSGVIALIAIPFFTPPAPESWPYIATSTIFQIIYVFLVAAAYSQGDMSLAYPVMRGTPPLLVALLGVPLIGEMLALPQWIAIVLISGGVLIMALDSSLRFADSGSRKSRSRTLVLALINAVFIASYTLVDGIGVRKSGSAVSYTLWAFLLNAIPLVIWGFYKYRGLLFVHIRERGHLALMGGAGTLGSYGLALWAMTMAPVAAVAALRETAIVFAMLLSVIFLRERVGMKRIIGAALIVCGTMLMRLM